MILVEFLKGETFEEIKKVLISLEKRYSFTLLGKSEWRCGGGSEKKYYYAFEGRKK